MIFSIKILCFASKKTKKNKLHTKGSERVLCIILATSATALDKLFCLPSVVLELKSSGGTGSTLFANWRHNGQQYSLLLRNEISEIKINIKIRDKNTSLFYR